jgi:hypothetical protein
MERIQPEKVVELFKKNGIEITTQQAILILDFLYKMANIAVSQYLIK